MTPPVQGPVRGPDQGPGEEPGARREHRPRKGFWARFSEQETGPPKVLVGLAGTMTALATTVGGIYALTNIVDDDPPTVATDASGATSTPSPTQEPTGQPSTDASSSSAEPTSGASGIPLRPGQTLVTQGSPAADDLVHALVDEPGARADLDVVIVAERRETSPQFIMRLWYNCRGLPAGQPPGEDLCDSAMLVFDDAYPPGPVLLDRPRRIELRGTWADNRPTGLGYGARGLEIYPVPASTG